MYPKNLPAPVLPIQARGIRRGDDAGPVAAGAPTDGVQAAAADCRKLRGPAREMCYKATAGRR